MYVVCTVHIVFVSWHEILTHHTRIIIFISFDRTTSINASCFYKKIYDLSGVLCEWENVDGRGQKSQSSLAHVPNVSIDW